MKVIVLKYTPEVLDDIESLLPSLASRYVALRYEQAPEHVFQPIACGNKKHMLFSPTTCNKHLKGKSCNITGDLAKKITFKKCLDWNASSEGL